MSEPMDTQKFLKLLEGINGLISVLGINMDVVDGEVQCTMSLDHKHTGAPGVAHGGAVTTLLDSALGARALAHALPQGKATSTVELKVNFLRPARIGTKLYTTTEIQSSGRSLLVLSGKAFEEETGRQVAFAVGTFNLYEADLHRMNDHVHPKAPKNEDS